MSGQKNIQIEAVSQALIAEQNRRRAELAQQQAECQVQLDLFSAQVSALEQQCRQTRDRQQSLTQEVNRCSAQIEQLVAQERELKRRLKNMEQRILEAKKESEGLGQSIQEDVSWLNQQLQQVRELKSSAQSYLLQFEQELKQLDGREAVQAAQEIAQLQARQQALTAQLGTLNIQLAAFASNTTLGTVLDQFLGAATDLGYQVLRTFVNVDDVELFVTNTLGETIRLALSLAAKQAAEPTTDDRLRMVLQGQGQPTNQACIADTIKILERLRQRGVAVSLQVAEPVQPSGTRLAQEDVTRQRERNQP